MPTPIETANTFIQRHGVHVGGISHMKLQKLTYYVHCWWLWQHDFAVLTESPEVWQYGPVFSSMYRAMKGFGSQPIAQPVREFPNQAAPVVNDNEHAGLVVGYIDWVWGHYANYTAIQLSDKTHAPGTPWRIIAEANGFRVPRHQIIPNEIIRQCFRGNYEEVLRSQ